MRSKSIYLLFFLFFSVFLSNAEARNYGYSYIESQPPSGGAERTVYAESGTVLDYSTAYYYDPGIQGTLFENAIITDVSPQWIAPNATEINIWTEQSARQDKTYKLHADHYVRAYFYQNTSGGARYIDYFGFNNFTGIYSPPYNFLQGPTGYYYHRVYKVATTQVQIHIARPPLHLSGIDATAAIPGNTIATSLRGTGLFGNNQSIQVSGRGVTATVRSGQIPNTIEVLDIDIEIAPDADVGDHSITLTVDGQTSNPVTFRVGDRSPQITNITPPEAGTGEQVTVTISGTGFGLNPDVAIDGLGVSRNIISSSSIQIQAVFSVADSTYEGNRNVSVISRGVSGSGFVQTPGSSNTSNSVGFEVKPTTASIAAFGVVGKGSTVSVTVSVFPVNNTKPINLTIQRTTGSGDAQFANNSSTMQITRTQSVVIKGITESSVKDNLVLKADTRNAPARSFSVATVKITRTIAGQTSPTDITDATSTTIVGERINLTAEIQPTGLAVSIQKWIIPETIVKDFQVSADKTQGMKIAVDPLNTSKVNFVWVDGGGATVNDFVTKEVKYTASIDRQSLTSKSLFQVKRPVVALETITSQTSLLQNPDGTEDLIFATNTDEGIIFKNTVIPMIPSPFTGTTQWVQIVNRSDNNLTVNGITATDNQNGLDGCYPYKKMGVGLVADSPYITLPVLGSLDAATANSDNDFTMWLMFRPNSPESVWVPLKKVDWYWKATANFSRGWSFSGQNSIKPGFVDTVVFPNWTIVVPSKIPCPTR